ncbi:hypothetical protein [Paenibacillus sp. BIHB 4019]|uniref:alpha/beta fold hydrolase n=1 Tax=Paenibacillus sp. BIHB 4019 TaxID=1870819 RepID=UPI001559E4A9|nr:hypothetical protein [Paenibacillus sp. BIHB 4019]
MKFRTYGNKNLPAVMLVHGAMWSRMFDRQAEMLQHRYHVILPTFGWAWRRE